MNILASIRSYLDVNEQLRRTNAELETVNKRIENENVELLQRIDDVQISLDLALSNLEYQTAENKRLAELAQSRSERLNVAREEIDRLNGRLTATEAQLISEQQHSARLGGALEIVQAAADKQIETLQAQRDELTGQVEELNAQVALLKSGKYQTKMFSSAPEAGGEMPQIDEEELAPIDAVFVYKLVGVFFDNGPGRPHYWQLKRERELISAAIKDKAFLERVTKRKEFFAAGDAIEAEFHVRQFRRSNGDITAAYSITRVIKIVAPDEFEKTQLRLTDSPPAALPPVESETPATAPAGGE